MSTRTQCLLALGLLLFVALGFIIARKAGGSAGQQSRTATASSSAAQQGLNAQLQELKRQMPDKEVVMKNAQSRLEDMQTVAGGSESGSPVRSIETGRPEELINTLKAVQGGLDQAEAE